MKKLIYSAAAMALAFFAVSCQQENLEPIAKANTVTYTVQVADAVATKALGDDIAAVNELVYEVYRTVEEGETEFTGVDNLLYHKTAKITNGTATIELEFVNDQNFTVLFWAQTKDNGVYDATNLTEVKITSPDAANNANAQAFVGRDFVKDCVSDANGKVTLVRPVSQLNIATTPESLEKFDDVIALEGSSVKVTGLATSYNIATLSAFGETATEYTDTETAVPTDVLNVNGVDYTYVAMNYVGFAPEMGANVTVSYVINTTEGDIDNEIVNVPVKPNYRTNIVGNLITSKTAYTITLHKDWYTPSEYAYVWDGSEMTAPEQNAEGAYEVSQASDLAWLAAAVNGTLPETRAANAPQDFAGKTFVLTSDIDLGGHEWTPISMSTNLAKGETFRGTFDGQGHTIKGLNSNQKDVAALFGYVYACTIKNVTIDGATLASNHYAGGIVGWVLNNKGNIQVPFVLENCHVKNSTITSTPELVNGEWDNGDKVGGLVGYAVFTGNTEAKISNCSVENTTVKAYRDFAGLVGYAKDVTIQNCAFTNLNLEQDLTHDYKAPNTPTTFGEYIGRSEGGNTINGNFYVASIAEFQAAVNAATGDATILLGANIEGNVTIVQKPGVKITVEGNGKKYNGQIKVHSNSNYYADAALTIKNVNFETSAASINVIEALENGSQRYSSNITVENCTFTATGAAVNTSVAVQVKATRGVTVTGCTATDMHSLIQAQSCDTGDVKVVNCAVNGKNGVAFKQVKAATVEGTTITALAYGIRFDGNTDNYGIVVKDNTVTAVQPLIVRKMTGANNTIALEGANTLATEADYQIVVTNGSDDEEYVMPTGTYTLTGADSYKVFPTYPAMIGQQTYNTLAAAVAAVKEGETIVIAGTISEGTIKLPATLKNVTFQGKAGVVLKDMTISAADGNSYNYQNLTFDGLTFDNSRILLTGWRNGEEVIENLTVTNCTFQNLYDTTNSAPVHINKDASEAVNGFTFTNNVIDGATGGSKSGIYAQVTGNVVVTGNVINNVSFRPYVIQVTTDDGIADSFVVTGNTFSGSKVGRAQGLGNNDAGTDQVNLVVSQNIFKGITDSQQICYWNFNAEKTTATLSHNYYDIDIAANPSRIYYNKAAASVADLVEMGVYPIYTELNADGTINKNSLTE